MSEQTTSELISILGHDVDRCHRELVASIDAGSKDDQGNVEADYEYHARQLIRSIFAFIEAVTFSAKIWAVAHCLDEGIEVTDGERLLAGEKEYGLKDTGEVKERPARIRLAENIRFAFALQEKALGLPKQFDANTEWWSCLKSSIKLRDRLMHPKFPNDVAVSGSEITTALKAYVGFKDQLISYAAQRRN